MTDFQLICAIAVYFGFEDNFSYEILSDEEWVIWDAECNKVPNYIKILGRPEAESLLVMLTTIKLMTEQI